MKKIVIAIDGHSSSGKSTMAKELAQEIGYVYIDTGAMYRAVTLYALRQGYIQGNSINEKALEADMPRLSITFQSNPGTGKSDTFLNGEDVEKEIRGMEVANKVSLVASIGFVGKEKGIVMDGRDIGTVVFPHAELKLFVTASPEVRAQRRVDELLAKGEKVSYEEVLENVKKRDFIDSTREESPLRKADDAIVLDNSNMSRAEQKAWLREKFEAYVKE